MAAVSKLEASARDHSPALLPIDVHVRDS